MPAAATADARDTFIGLSEAARRLGRSPTFVMKACIRGEIRVRSVRGRTPVYSSADVARIAEELRGGEGQFEEGNA